MSNDLVYFVWQVNDKKSAIKYQDQRLPPQPSATLTVISKISNNYSRRAAILVFCAATTNCLQLGNTERSEIYFSHSGG